MAKEKKDQVRAAEEMFGFVLELFDRLKDDLLDESKPLPKGIEQDLKDLFNQVERLEAGSAAAEGRNDPGEHLAGDRQKPSRSKREERLISKIQGLRGEMVSKQIKVQLELDASAEGKSERKKQEKPHRKSKYRRGGGKSDWKRL